MIQFSYVWANLRYVRICLQLRVGFLCCTCAPNHVTLKARLTLMLDNNLQVSIWSCFALANAVPSQPSLTRVIQRLFSGFTRNFGHPPLCFSISPPTGFLICTREDWLMPTKVATLQVETSLLSCTKAWCFSSWENGQIQLQTILQIAPHILWNQRYTMDKKSHNVLNYTMHTKMSMLEEWQGIKMSIVILTTSTFLILETLHFLVSHLWSEARTWAWAWISPITNFSELTHDLLELFQGTYTPLRPSLQGSYP